MKAKAIIVALFAFFGAMGAQAQTAVKSNLVYDLTATLNAGVEFAVAPKWTVDVSANINQWTKWKHLMVQPEARYWLGNAFSGTFVGAHLIAGLGNAGGFSMPIYDGFKDNRSKGSFFGLGIGCGYAYNFNEKWGLEGELGLGYIHFGYDKYDVDTDVLLAEDQSKSYFGPTKAAISLVYHF